MTDFWTDMARPGPESITLGGVELRRGSRVVLHPRAGRDVFDLALAERVAIVEAIEEDAEGKVHLAVTVEDDPGRELGDAGVLGHRFFFGVEEVEPMAAAPQPSPPTRVLIAGIGNIFLGDDAFGVEVATQLLARRLPDGIDVVDFGIRGFDLAYALQAYDAVVFVDAAPRGEQPGTLSVIEPELEELPLTMAVETHGMDPVRVLGLAGTLGRLPEHVRVVACEPACVVAGTDAEDLAWELSEPVSAAVEPAADLALRVAVELLEIKRKVVQR